jgi:hypothetical protein
MNPYYWLGLHFIALFSEYLSGGGNWFNGTIPSAIGMIPTLKELWMSTNTFSGPLPENIGNASELGKFSVELKPVKTSGADVDYGTFLCNYRSHLFMGQRGWEDEWDPSRFILQSNEVEAAVNIWTCLYR